MPLNRYKIKIIIPEETPEKRMEATKEIEKILKEEKIDFFRAYRKITIYGNDRISDFKMQKYAVKLIQSKGVEISTLDCPLDEPIHSDEQLVSYVKKLVFEKEVVTVSDVRAEIHVSAKRATRIMNMLVEDGFVYPRNEKKWGSKWRLRKLKRK